MCKVIEEKQIAKISDFEVVAFTECFKISLIVSVKDLVSRYRKQSTDKIL